jgi:hypothetical protein
MKKSTVQLEIDTINKRNMRMVRENAKSLQKDYYQRLHNR